MIFQTDLMHRGHKTAHHVEVVRAQVQMLGLGLECLGLNLDSLYSVEPIISLYSGKAASFIEAQQDL